MLVRFKTTVAGPEFTAQAGDVVDMAGRDDLAASLLEGGTVEEVAELRAETTTRFHGGLIAVRPALVARTDIPPPPDISTFGEHNEVDPGGPIERRTADEMARQAALAAAGPIRSADPLPFKSSDQRADEETAAKIQQAQAAAVDVAASAHEALVADADDLDDEGKPRKSSRSRKGK